MHPKYEQLTSFDYYTFCCNFSFFFLKIFCCVYLLKNEGKEIKIAQIFLISFLSIHIPNIIQAKLISSAISVLSCLNIKFEDFVCLIPFLVSILISPIWTGFSITMRNLCQV